MNTGQVSYSTSMMGMADTLTANAFNAVGYKRTGSNWAVRAAELCSTSRVAIELGYAHKARSQHPQDATGARDHGELDDRWYGDGNGYVGNLNHP